MTTLDRIEALEKKQAEQDGKLDSILSHLHELRDHIRNLGDMTLQTARDGTMLQDDLSNLSDSLIAVSSVLQKNGAISAKDVADQLLEDKAARERNIIKGLVDNGIVEASNEPVNPDSIIAVSRSEMDVADPTKSGMLESYKVLNLSMPQINKQLVTDLSGRRVGETITLQTDPNSYTLFTVLEVYQPKKLESLSE